MANGDRLQFIQPEGISISDYRLLQRSDAIRTPHLVVECGKLSLQILVNHYGNQTVDDQARCATFQLTQLHARENLFGCRKRVSGSRLELVKSHGSAVCPV